MAPSATPSRTVRDRLAQDDDEIARLERKLGIRKKSKKAPGEDGLDDLLGDLDASDDGEAPSTKRKSQDNDWLQEKRRKVEVVQVESDFEGFSDSEDDNLGDSALPDNDEVTAIADDHSKEDGTRSRENPYVAPSTGGKYVPPSLRKVSATDDGAVVRLRRRVKGLINRLAESNLLSILQSLETLYLENARQHVTQAVIDTLLALVADVATLTDTFIVLHAGFVAAIYRTIGVDFGAQFLERIVTSLDQEPHGKRAANLISLLSAMYNFEVVSCHLIYDLVRQYVTTLSEEDTELLLRVIRTCGTQLRQDDASALKDVITTVQSKARELGEGAMSVRQKFMVDTMNDLKNNRLRVGMASSAGKSESMTSMRKLLGTVKARSSKASEPFRLSLQDLRESDKKGKWWLVGASYHDPAKMAATSVNSKHTAETRTLNTGAEQSDDLAAIARAMGMNTDTRRVIFAAIMTSTDYKEASFRIKKLNLKRSQIEEIAKVLFQCAMAEDTYNQYYSILARDFCHERPVNWAFQTLLWDHIKRMDIDEDSDEVTESVKLSAQTIVCLAKFYAALIRPGALPITILRPVEWSYVQPRTKMFLEILLTTIILDKSKVNGGLSAEDVLCRVSEIPDMIRGFRYFLESAVATSTVPEKARHQEKIAVVCRAVTARLAAEARKA